MPESREYLGFEDANKVLWKIKRQLEARKNWKNWWGDGPWMKEYNKWVCTGINRAMRKPSHRSIEWLAWRRTWETAPVGEQRTRKEVLPKIGSDSYNCCPCPHWPATTYGEIGWLGKHKNCQLEMYANDFKKKPPLPAHMAKVSSFLSNSQ